MTRHYSACLLAVALVITPIRGAEIFVPQGWAEGAAVEGGGNILWSTDALFLNTQDLPATVNVLGVSNGGANSGSPGSFTLQPGTSASLTRALRDLRPTEPAPLWVVRLDLPEGALVENMLFIGLINNPPTGFAAINQYKYGKARLPVVTALVPPNTTQRHLATFLGSPFDIPSRLNVAIYNGGPGEALARIEIRQHCDDAIIDARTVAVAPDTIIQATGLQAPAPACNAPALTFGAPPGAVYTLVTVDQPSFSFVSIVANDQLPITTFGTTKQ